MSLPDLLAQRRLRSHRTNPGEVADLLTIVERNLAAAEIAQVPADIRFTLAYGAAVTVATIALAAAGYHTAGLGHHQTTFEALPYVLGPEVRARADYLDDCRLKRNTTEYYRAGEISGPDAERLLAEARSFRADVLAWLRATHPELLPR